jgi:hypothetical protein
LSLEERIRAELLAIRKTSDGLTVAALTHSPVISGLLGNGDPRLAYNTLKHAILSAEADTSLKAATSSLGLASDKRTHLGRLDDFGAEYGYDQRQVRRYSDKGVQQIARFISSSWITDAVPCLDVFGYQTGPDTFMFTFETKRQYVIEMQPVRAVLYVGSDEPRELEVPLAGSEDGIWRQARSTQPIEVEAKAETSLAWTWRGELWPKFGVQWRTDLQGHGVTSESVGNKVMIRILPIPSSHDAE